MSSFHMHALMVVFLAMLQPMNDTAQISKQSTSLELTNPGPQFRGEQLSTTLQQNPCDPMHTAR